MGIKSRIATYITIGFVAFRLGGCARDVINRCDCYVDHNKPEINMLSEMKLDDYNGALYCITEQDFENVNLEALLR